MRTYVGVPYVDGGRNFDGCDCWGIVRLYLEREAQLHLPSYSETPARDLEAVDTAFASEVQTGSWQRIERESLRRFDVVQMWTFENYKGRQIKGRRHVGVMVDDRSVLHIEIGTAAVIVPLNHPSVRERLVAFWRHRNLTGQR